MSSRTKALVVLGAGFILAAVGLQSASAAGDGLVALWKFEEGGGTVATDSSGNNNNGIIHGGPTWVAGTVGLSLNMDGVNDYIEVPKSASLDSLGHVTLMGWVKTPADQRYSIFARWLYGGTTNERAFELDVGSVGRLVKCALSGTGSGGSWVTSANAVPTNKWTHIAATSDGQKLRIYINGVLDPSTADAPTTIHPSAGNLNIGAWYAEGIFDNYFKGQLDELSIYSRALTAEEILQQYQQGSPRGSVTGTVTDTQASPIAGATVQAGLFSGVTDATGHYTIPDVPADTYDVTASKVGYRRSTRTNVTVYAGQAAVANFALSTDTTAPVISGVAAIDVASLSAWIVWTTDESADGSVEFGTASGVYDRTVSDAAYATSHKLALTGLSPTTKYYFVVTSVDQALNIARSSERTLTTDELGDVVVWDTNKYYTMKNPTTNAMNDKEKWTQVPYGRTHSDYTFNGDAMITNEYCQLFLFTNKEDSVNLAAKLENGGIAGNEIYKVNDLGRRHFGMGTVYSKLLKNTPDEMVMEHAGRSTSNVVTIYTIWANKPWLQVEPKSYVNQQGMHGKTRICAFVKNDGTEMIFDSKREPWTVERIIPAPAGSIGIINFDRFWTSRYDLMWFLAFSPGAENSRLTYLGFHWDPFWGEEVSPDRPSVGAQYAYMAPKVAIATLRYRNCWTRENVESQISAGQTYTTDFAPPYPGKWRLIGRVDSAYHSSTVDITQADVDNGRKFVFTSPAGGYLDYMLMYLRDRNADTPPDVYTVMDVYREAIEGRAAGPLGRYVFYNSSAFDFYDPAANAADDDAIATDKTALLPGQTAAFANYTSCIRGINGIMVDIANVPGTPGVGDFVFKVGNDDNPDSWAAAPSPASVTVRPGAGVDGSDRVTITWANAAIQKQWLQVTIKATAATGLLQPDVFYFGNAIGDSGNSSADTKVDTTDEIRARLDPHKHQLNPAGIENPHDYDRNGVVDTTDEIIARLFNTTLLNDLNLITAP